MGDCPEGIEASGGSGSRKAHHVGISPQEDRDGTKVAMVEGAGGAEEGGVKFVRAEVRNDRQIHVAGVVHSVGGNQSIGEFVALATLMAKRQSNGGL